MRLRYPPAWRYTIGRTPTYLLLIQANDDCRGEELHRLPVDRSVRGFTEAPVWSRSQSQARPRRPGPRTKPAAISSPSSPGTLAVSSPSCLLCDAWPSGRLSGLPPQQCPSRMGNPGPGIAHPAAWRRNLASVEQVDRLPRDRVR